MVVCVNNHTVNIRAIRSNDTDNLKNPGNWNIINCWVDNRSVSYHRLRDGITNVNQKVTFFLGFVIF